MVLIVFSFNLLLVGLSVRRSSDATYSWEVPKDIHTYMPTHGGHFRRWNHLHKSRCVAGRPTDWLFGLEMSHYLLHGYMIFLKTYTHIDRHTDTQTGISVEVTP